MISVCMATFNGARYVHEQVASILPQLEPGDELVVSDDGSDDDTVAIVMGFGDPRIRILEGNAFRSPLRNFERAMRHARGEVIVLSDQDDTWLESKLPLVRELFAEDRSRPLLVVLDAEVVDDDGLVTDPSVFAKLDAGPGVLENSGRTAISAAAWHSVATCSTWRCRSPAASTCTTSGLASFAERVGTTRFVPTVTMRYRRHAANATGFEVRFQPIRQVRRRLRSPGTCFGAVRAPAVGGQTAGEIERASPPAPPRLFGRTLAE